MCAYIQQNEFNAPFSINDSITRNKQSTSTGTSTSTSTSNKMIVLLVISGVLVLAFNRSMSRKKIK